MSERVLFHVKQWPVESEGKQLFHVKQPLPKHPEVAGIKLPQLKCICTQLLLTRTRVSLFMMVKPAEATPRILSSRWKGATWTATRRKGH